MVMLELASFIISIWRDGVLGQMRTCGQRHLCHALEYIPTTDIILYMRLNISPYRSIDFL